MDKCDRRGTGGWRVYPAGALAIGRFGQSRWRLRRRGGAYGICFGVSTRTAKENLKPIGTPLLGEMLKKEEREGSCFGCKCCTGTDYLAKDQVSIAAFCNVLQESPQVFYCQRGSLEL